MILRKIKLASLIFACTLFFIPQCYAQFTSEQKHIEVSLRMIGHQVLLNAGDSTSRVLPIVKNSNQFRIEFDTAFGFNPQELVKIVHQIVLQTKIANHYIMEVKECETGEVVYSYEKDTLEQLDITPCGTRDQPKSCYSLVFTLLEGGNGEKFASIDSLGGKDFETSQMSYLTFIMLFALIGLSFFFIWKRKNKTIIDPNLIALGNYHFDKRNTTLLIEDQKIELTSKESDLLLLLYNAVNTTIEREVILKMVWGDEGDYVGRTLDVFISKLRKKLNADSNVKIVNTRGVGYKLVIDV